ncbi:MAG TPA: RHS repeat-associated core domain-containing protein [Chloroflexota bacterium]|nr:RHS repeat-associated core domain-containing protein [Chloroflexota bacterium]HUM69542.1 RHS repeat-associated core domain-containing protein [Chloroflexota bacterium]
MWQNTGVSTAARAWAAILRRRFSDRATCALPVTSLFAGGRGLLDMTRFLPFGGYRGSDPAFLTESGFTGHKMNNLSSNDLGLIYMNARYYVPYINRFISADSIVPNPANPQSYNRYSYVGNRPMTHT